ncbi:MAG: c-type cytochrome [Roseinatronobacter sp.]
MRKLVIAAAALAIAGAVAGWWLTAPAPLPAQAFAGITGDAVAGEQVFYAGGCASCHKGIAHNADPLILSGGRSFVTEFGTFRAPNISPDPVHGIGRWSFPQFANAVMRGVAPDGAHYYPAFPYTSYARAEVQDIADLFAFMQTLPAEATPSAAHDLGFPFTIRRGIGLWKQLYLNDDWVIASDLTEEQTRGRYLVEALAHCAECHTPRDAFGGLDTSRWMQGAPNPSGRGNIPAIAGARFTWTAFDISAYLETGFTPQFDVVGGSMGDVVKSLQKLPKSDLDAIAAYIVGLRDN